MPTLGAFVHELLSHHIALEGTLVASLKRLLLTPGGLTLDYFAGKRARYVAPLRLYLTFNVIFFLAVSIVQIVGVSEPADREGSTKAAQAARVETSASLSSVASELDSDDLSPEQRREVEKSLAKLQLVVGATGPAAASGEASADGAKPAVSSGDVDVKARWKTAEDFVIPRWVDRYLPSVRKRLDVFAGLTSQDQLDHLSSNLVHYAPYTLLLVLPVCALLLQMAFVGSGRRYVEHLVVALHGHTFLFIVLLFSLIPLGGFFGVIFMLAIAHMVLALRKIYGSSWLGLIPRLGFLSVSYVVAVTVATLFAVTASVIT